MKQAEFLSVVTNGLKEQEHKVTKELVKAVLDVAETTVDEVITKGDKVTVLGVVFNSKEQAGRTGTIMKGERTGQTWVTPKKIVPTVKMKPSKKEALSREI